jgi:hypothetical protein
MGAADDDQPIPAIRGSTRHFILASASAAERTAGHTAVDAGRCSHCPGRSCHRGPDRPDSTQLDDRLRLVPTVFSGLLAGGVNWPAVTNAQQLWGTFEQHPVLSGSTYRFSVYVKGSTTFKLGARPFVGAVEQANVLDATNNTATGAWTRFSWLYTPAVGVTSAYFGLNATGSGNLQTTGWMVQTDEALKAWTFGHGCPEIAANVSVAASYWKLRSKFQLVLQEV